jgi:hypothetical protein
MATLARFGLYSYQVMQEAARNFFAPIFWVASLMRFASSTHSKGDSVAVPMSDPQFGRKEFTVYLPRIVVFVAALLVSVGMLAWHIRQREEYERKIAELEANNQQLSSLMDEVFRQIDSIARREGGPPHVSLRGCQLLSQTVYCTFYIDASAKFTLFLERGTKFVDEHGNQYQSDLAISTVGFGGLTMGTGGIVVRGPLQFTIKFQNVRPETGRIILLETLAAEGDEFVIYQFRDVAI